MNYNILTSDQNESGLRTFSERQEKYVIHTTFKMNAFSVIIWPLTQECKGNKPNNSSKHSHLDIME